MIFLPGCLLNGQLNCRINLLCRNLLNSAHVVDYEMALAHRMPPLGSVERAENSYARNACGCGEVKRATVMPDKKERTPHRRRAFPRCKSTTQIQFRPRPGRSQLIDTIKLVGRAEEYQPKSSIVRRHQAK